MSDHNPCIKLNQSNWTVDGAGEPVNCDERNEHPDDEEVLDDEYELPNIDVYDILGGAAPIIGKYFSVFGGGDEDTNVRIVQGLVLAARIYRDMKELVEKDDKKGVEELVSVVFTKIFDLARAEYLSKEAKKEEERKAHEEDVRIGDEEYERSTSAFYEREAKRMTDVIDAYIARKKALKKKKAERVPVTDLY